ncbi:MAG: hypothetical protein AVDCRST_MAG58-675, partial [uncultured Rubrobacteraceae bacterium]
GLPERVGWRGMATGAGVRAPGGRAYLRTRPRRSAGCRRGGVGGGGV